MATFEPPLKPISQRFVDFKIQFGKWIKNTHRDIEIGHDEPEKQAPPPGDSGKKTPVQGTPADKK